MNQKTLTIKIRKVDNNPGICRRVAVQIRSGRDHKDLISRKHLNYLRSWCKKFAFPVPVALYVYPYRKKGFNNALARLSTFNQTAWVGLSTRTLKDRDDWRNSIVHELIHLLFLLTIGDSRVLSHQGEEDLAIMLSTWLSRSKAGRDYAKRIYG